MTTVKGVVENR